MTLSDPERLGSREDSPTVAGRLGHGLAELASDIREVLAAAVPALRDDDEAGALQASIQRDIDAMLTQEARGGPVAERPPVPSAALEHARGLARRGISLLAVIRAYRTAERRFLRRLIVDVLQRGNVEGPEANETLRMVDRVSDYVDLVVHDLVADYSQARKEWLNPDAIRAARVRSVLSDRDLDLETAQTRLGAYRLRQHHLGVELWIDQPDPGIDALALIRRVTDALAQAAQSSDRPLCVPLDEVSGCAWLGIGERTVVNRERLAETLEGFPGVYTAAGDVHGSLPGFRRTHQQALSAEIVARVRMPPLERLTAYSDVAPIAAMANDRAAARAWVTETLGDLAIDDARHALLRETARVFFETGGSYAATAERLSIHRNTAQYRVRTAEEMRGRPFRDGRLDVELALLAAHWFGPAVLTAATAKQAE